MAVSEIERLAKVEERVNSIDARLEKIQGDVREVRDGFAKQRGFVAGFSAAFTLLWAVITGVVIHFWRT